MKSKSRSTRWNDASVTMIFLLAFSMFVLSAPAIRGAHAMTPYSISGTFYVTGPLAGQLCNSNGGTFTGTGTETDQYTCTIPSGVEWVIPANGTLNNIQPPNAAATAAGVGALNIINHGTIVNYGTINNQWAIYNINTTINEATGIINSDDFIGNEASANFTNYGTINVGGTLDNAGVLVNYNIIDTPSGTIFNYDSGNIINKAEGIIDNVGYFVNAAQVNNFGTFANAGTAYYGAQVENSGTFNNYNNFDNAGWVTNSGTFNNLADGTITNQASAVLYNPGFINNNGTIDDYGTLTNENPTQAPIPIITNYGTVAIECGGSFFRGFEAIFKQETGSTFTQESTADCGTIIVSTTNSQSLPISGLYVTLWQNGAQVASCFSACSFTVNNGATYQVMASSYGSETFSYWQNPFSTGAETVTMPGTSTAILLTGVYSP